MDNDTALREYNLKKVIQYWGVKEGEYAYYMLAPPWIKLDPKEMMTLLYPEAVRANSLFSQKYNPARTLQLYSKNINP